MDHLTRLLNAGMPRSDAETSLATLYHRMDADEATIVDKLNAAVDGVELPIATLANLCGMDALRAAVVLLRGQDD